MDTLRRKLLGRGSSRRMQLDILQVDRLGGGQRRGRTFKATFAGQDRGGTLGEVGARRPGHRPVGQRHKLTGLGRAPDVELKARGVVAVA